MPRTLLALAVGLAAGGCQPRQYYYDLTVTVTDADTGRPVATARVHLRPGMRPGDAVMAGADGVVRHAFQTDFVTQSEVADPQLTVAVTHPDYPPTEVRVGTGRWPSTTPDRRHLLTAAVALRRGG